MTTKEQNDRLTQVGPGTPMGALLRRYWQPVGAACEFDSEPVRSVRILGENLTLYKSENGEYGLIGERCPHRRVSMEYGIPDPKGLRCPYHGWLFDKKGHCVEMPYDDRVNPDSTYKDRVKMTAYPVQELSGLLFAYLGPEPVPLLPRWDVLAREDLDAVIVVNRLPCNWLQCMDNAADPVHFEYLHAALGNYALKRQGLPPKMQQGRHLKIEFDRFPFGIMKRRLLEGESEDCDDWKIGHPLLFPNILAVGDMGRPTLQFRVPVDDTNTIQFAYRTSPRAPGAPRKPVGVKHVELFNAAGKIVPDNVPSQDMLAWVMQGPISDRENEHLSLSDKGVILYHRMLHEEMDKVARGEDPMGIVRDPAENEPMIDLCRERKALQPFQSKYSTTFDRVTKPVGEAAE